MPQSHSTEEAEPALTHGSSTTDALTEEPELTVEALGVPDSPATLWISISKSRITVDSVDCVPAELRDWVAPAVVVHANF